MTDSVIHDRRGNNSLNAKWKATVETKPKQEHPFQGKGGQPEQQTSPLSPVVTANENDMSLLTNKDNRTLNREFAHLGHASKSPATQTTASMTSVTNGEGLVEDSGRREFPLHFQRCDNTDFSPVLGRKGTVVGMFGMPEERSMFVPCTFSIPISDGFRFLFLLFHQPQDPCSETHWFDVSISDTKESRDHKLTCRTRYYQIFSENTAYITLFYRRDKDKVYGIFNSSIFYPHFRIDFESYNEDIRQYLAITRETSSSGYITAWGYDGIRNYLCVNNATYQLHLPENHGVMLSFARFDLNLVFTDRPYTGLWVYSLHGRQLIFYEGKHAVIPSNLYFTSLLFHFKTQKFCEYCQTGFRAIFSFHLQSEMPIKFQNSQFNCSTVNYPSFKKHLECNLEPECSGEEDEGGHCPYSSPECGGMVSSGTKCYAYINWRKPLSFYGARAECLKQSGDLAMMKTQSQWADLTKIFRYGKHFLQSWIGVKSIDSSFPPIYKRMLKWVDNSIAQNVQVLTDFKVMDVHRDTFDMCGVFRHSQKLDIEFVQCRDDSHVHFFICQQTVDRTRKQNASFPVMTFPKSLVRKTNRTLIVCPEGHATHDFLSCDYKSHCQINDRYVPQCRVARPSGYFTIKTFTCDDDTMTLPYSLLCDFRQDCDDASDETFCIHEHLCRGFRCQNGQCIEKEKRCNRENDCLDQSDERSCENELKLLSGEVLLPRTLKLPPPVRIDFDINRRVLQYAVKENEPCPKSHFQCTEPYCLPVYLYCNGVRDCPYGEDEVDCTVHQCPGYYRCRSSSVCVHVVHLCDGLPQCSQQDDEWLCHTGCPRGCLCQGHALHCFRSFSTHDFPHVRYLDATGSTMNMNDTKELRYIVYLSLERCNLHRVSTTNLPNLRILNLNHNQLTTLNMDVFMALSNLNTLLLSGNPMTRIASAKTQTIHAHLRSLDLSRTFLGTFSSDMISCFANVTHLDISSSQIHTILDTGFSKTLRLKFINLRGNPVSSYPQNMFRQLGWLRSILTDDFRFCCRKSLPESFPVDGTCTSYQMHLSSCEDLIPYSEHRILLFIVMVFAIVGNVSTLVFKLCIKKDVLSSSLDFLLTNVNVMDLLMGLYVLVIVTADWVYRQNYFSIQHVWTTSLACKTAGFLAVVSYHASSCTLFFISVHGFLSTYPHKVKTKVTKRVVYKVSAIIWAVALVVSLVPLVATDVEFRGRADNCLALVSAVNTTGPGSAYAIVTMVLLHLLLPSFTCVSQLLILWVKHFHDDLSLSITERSHKMAEATRVFPLISLDCVRRFTFCFIRLMALFGLAMPGKLQALYSFFIVPTNSAVNPVLYVVSVLMERRRQAAEQRLLQRLARRLAQPKGMPK